MSAPQQVSRQFLGYWVRHPEEGAPGKATLWTDPRILDKKFYADESTKKHQSLWVAVDNCGGEFFTEEFRTKTDAVAWLTDPEGRTGDEYKEDMRLP